MNLYVCSHQKPWEKERKALEKFGRNRSYRGKSACSGIAIGKIYYYDRELPFVEYIESTPEVEISRLQKAILHTGEQLSELIKTAQDIVGSEGADIFTAHLAISKDEGYKRRIIAKIEAEKANAEYAVHRISEDYAVMFESMDDAYMKERGSDMRAVGGRIIDSLMGHVRGAIELTEPVILLADDLTPGDTIRLDRKNILGFATKLGGMNSHTAILARALGIPAIVGATLPGPDSHGKRACLDGFTGNLILEPDAYTMQRMREKQIEWRSMKRERFSFKQKGMRYWANASSLEEVEYAAKCEVDGIGLFRTEFLYMGKNAPPSEEEQYSCYRDAMVAMNGKPVVFRLADLGSDKSEDYLGLKVEANPAMGMRGVRFLLSRPQYMRDQLRALCRASVCGDLRIMIPMVTSTEEIAAVREWVQRTRRELTLEGIPVAEHIKIGAMIETPAAALTASELTQYADFFSLGTNDLTQYTLAADRQTVFSDEMDGNTAAWELALSNPRHPAVCKLIEMTAAAAHDANVPLCVCGEMASDPQLTDFFLRAGIDSLSVSTSLLEDMG